MDTEETAINRIVNVADIQLREGDREQVRRQENISYWDFPSGPVARTLCSQHREPGFHSWLGN